MSKVAILLVCAAFSGTAWQNRPKLERVGTSDTQVSGNLGGFRALQPVWPNVTTTWPNGRSMSVSVIVAKGRAYQFHVTCDPGARGAKPFVDALKHWRFAMPTDGSSPVRFTVRLEALDGEFVVQETNSRLK